MSRRAGIGAFWVFVLVCLMVLMVVVVGGAMDGRSRTQITNTNILKTSYSPSPTTTTKPPKHTL